MKHQQNKPSPVFAMSHDTALSLSPVDHVFVADGSFPITFVFAFDKALDYARLHQALGQALELFFPLKGRLALQSDDRFAIVAPHVAPHRLDALGAATFQHTAIAHPIDPRDRPAIQALAHAVEPTVGAALASFKLTEGPNGCVLSASVSHRASDGYGVFSFLSAWAALARGSRPAVAPDHARSALWQPESGADLSRAGVFRRSGFSLMSEDCEPAQTARNCDEVLITHAALEARRELTVDAAGQLASVNAVLTALVVEWCVEAWHGSRTALRLSCAHDVRRFLPEPAARYFGNCTGGISRELEQAELQRFSVGPISHALHAQLRQFGSAQALDFLACIQGLLEHGGMKALQRMRIWDPQQGLLVSNMTRMPLANLDFGAGAPVAAYPLVARRCAMILAAPEGYRVLIGRPEN